MLQEDEELLISRDDFRDYDHMFAIAPQRLKSHAIVGVYPGAAFRDFKAYRPEMDQVMVVG